MAQDLPPARLPILKQFYNWGRPVLSGEEDIDQRYGIRGISSQLNHLYSYHTHKIASYYPIGAHNTEFFSTAAGLADVTGQIAIELGANVKYLACTADVEDADLYLTTTLGNGDTTALALVGRSVVTATTAALSDQTGVEAEIKIQIDQVGAPTAKIYSFIIYEVVLTATDIP